jgi:hypothetical protein
MSLTRSRITILTMIYEFTATKAYSGDDDETFIIAGVASRREPPQYLNFQRSIKSGNGEDGGIHLEFDDQINSGHDKIAACSLRRGTLRVDLIEPIDRENKYGGMEIDLRVGDAEWQSLAAALRKIFAGREAILDVEGDQHGGA